MNRRAKSVQPTLRDPIPFERIVASYSADYKAHLGVCDLPHGEQSSGQNPQTASNPGRGRLLGMNLNNIGATHRLFGHVRDGLLRKTLALLSSERQNLEARVGIGRVPPSTSHSKSTV